MSPKTISAPAILQAISEESTGFRFGKPDRLKESSLACVLPILRETSRVRQYITLPETDAVQIYDSGAINKIKLKNDSKSNVFVRSGTIFEGKQTQTRALMRSAVLFPGHEAALDVRCIHQSHPIRAGGEFQYGGFTPLGVDSALYQPGFRPQNQQRTWDVVRGFNTSMRFMLEAMRVTAGKHAQSVGIAVRPPAPVFTGQVEHGPLEFAPSPAQMYTAKPLITRTPEPASGVPDVPVAPVGPPVLGRIVLGPAGDDNLKQNLDDFSAKFDKVLSEARLHENQVGLALIAKSGCKTIELFDLPASWEAIHKEAVKRMGAELLLGSDDPSVFEYKPEHAVSAVRKVLALDYATNLIYEHKPSNGEPHVAIFGLSASGYVGEIVEVEGRVIHLNILETVA